MSGPRRVEFTHGTGSFWLMVAADSDGVGEVAAFKAELDKASVLARRVAAAGPSIRGVQRLPQSSGRLLGRRRVAAMSRVLGHSMIVSASSVIPVNDNVESEAVMSKQAVESMKASEVAAVLGFSGTPRVYQLAKDGRLVKTAEGISRASVEAYQAAKVEGAPKRRGRPVGSKNAKPSMAVRVESKVAKAASVNGGRWVDASLSELVAELEAVKLEILRKIGA